MTEIGKVLEGMMPFPKLEGVKGEASDEGGEREGGGEDGGTIFQPKVAALGHYLNFQPVRGLMACRVQMQRAFMCRDECNGLPLIGWL